MPPVLADHLFPILLALNVLACTLAVVLVMVRGERTRDHAELVHRLSRQLRTQQVATPDQPQVDAAFLSIVAGYHRKR
jgi:hypothetical protein